MSARATEEPAWSLVGTLDGLGIVELRAYEPVVQARTPMPGDTSSSTGFRTLADYIFGGNEGGQEIAMTAPVERTLSGDDDYMAFTMPEAWELETLPLPEDDNVTLHAVPARTLAVVKFSGWARDKAVQENVRTLLNTLASNDIEPRGPSTWRNTTRPGQCPGSGATK